MELFKFIIWSIDIQKKINNCQLVIVTSFINNVKLCNGLKFYCLKIMFWNKAQGLIFSLKASRLD